ncbi:mannose-6-phosphate isomerase, type 1 [Abditibacterium utsteinense]|uniref:Phosphohexomutase n=1 Tax=Abditibacterium utsteinense TaxID=1960156 RepID=A0A2S8SXP1_9BACT|nr:type I phosphomannose isomerase catalytic subunit [Abditibacterium utsteinense]PQV65561.1 mannose-6-phosphate isomerase, type 1 [Abditibacterium utsteinense]
MLYPLKFKPFLKHYPYGGRRFAQVLEMDVPHDRDIAESWEISDHGQEQSIVVNGPLAGRTLRSLMEEFKGELVGEGIYAQYGDYFPLLVKFLDCDKRLPAHMHPDDETARALGVDKAGKAEAWYIVRADATAEAYCSALSGLTSEKFAAAIQSGDTYDGVMKKIPTRTGDTYYVPSGRLHGLDAGNLAFEIQQNSDAGFGWDWAGFVEAGVVPAADAEKHKSLAVEHASYEDGPQEQTKEITLVEDDDERTFCCACRYFVLERLKIRGKTAFGDTSPRFNTFTLINGAAIFEANGEEVFAKRGESLLIPAGVSVSIAPNSLANGGEVEILRCYVPDLKRDVVDFLRESGIDDKSIAWLGSYGKGNDLLPLLGLAQDLFNVGVEERHEAAVEHRASDIRA